MSYEKSNEFLQYFMNIAILKAKTRSNYKNQVINRPDSKIWRVIFFYLYSIFVF